MEYKTCATEVLAQKLKKILRVQMQPVTSNVDGHAEHEEETVARVEAGEHHQQAHGPAAVRQLVQHRTELGTYREDQRQRSPKQLRHGDQ